MTVTADSRRRRVVIMGAAGRDFHDFNMVFRDDPTYDVVRVHSNTDSGHLKPCYDPADLAGPLYPDGIPIRPETELEDVISELNAQEVVFAYSDLSHESVMHIVSRVLATGADFKLLGPGA